ncbi:MAG: hypothetical protein Q9195_007498 [Heterodermia aff. obscurata]
MAPSYDHPSWPASSIKSKDSGKKEAEALNQWSSFRQASIASAAPPIKPRVQQKVLHDAQNSKTPGHNPHSAHFSKQFACTYESCGRRFDNQKSLIIHKDKEHDYCRVCDEDFKDDEALHFHKMQSEKHVVCNICGVEFKSEPGRDRHAKQMHAATQNVQCRGCSKVFAKGSGLLLHFEQNACKPLQSILLADSQVHGKAMLESNRALLAMQMEKLAIEEAKKLAARSGTSAVATSAASESEGGVRLQPSILDDMPTQSVRGGLDDGSTEFENLIEYASVQSAPKDKLQKPLIPMSSRSQSVATSGSSGDSTATAKAWAGKYPTLQPQNKAQSGAEKQDLQEGMDNISVSGSVNSFGSGPWGMGPGSSVWGNASKKLFPNARPTPVPDDINIDNLRSIDVGEDAAEAAGMKGTKLNANPEDGLFHCPFPICEVSATDAYQIVEHIQTHTGVDNRCSACLRTFGSASALVAHMESASTRCNIRATKGFNNAIHIVSGGFLGAYGRLEDGTIKLESQKKPESFW